MGIHGFWMAGTLVAIAVTTFAAPARAFVACAKDRNANGVKIRGSEQCRRSETRVAVDADTLQGLTPQQLIAAKGVSPEGTGAPGLSVIDDVGQLVGYLMVIARAHGSRPPGDLQIMYGISGERSLPGRELSHLAGHRDSAPVRIGNGAVKQMQLDCYGQLLEAAWLVGKAGGTLTAQNWAFLAGLADVVCDRWREPDHGIWEIRDRPRHFTHSKLNCCVALDRAARIAARLGQSAGVARWHRERDAVRAYLLEEAASDGWFTQAVGVAAADASTLLVPAMGLLPTSHPLALRTIEVVERDLARDGLVHRYLHPDGGEGAFLLCSFWLLDCLTHAGRLDAADALLARLLALANDVGLYPEEVDPASGEALGNCPQAFTHMALVPPCAHLSAAKRRQLPFEGAHDYAELALDRLLARGRPLAEA